MLNFSILISSIWLGEVFSAPEKNNESNNEKEETN